MHAPPHYTIDMKACTKCKVSKADSEFYPRKFAGGRIGLRPDCKECGRNNRDRWRETSPIAMERSRAYNRKNAVKIRGCKLQKYWPGVTWEEALERYAALHKAQGGVCALCGRKERRKHPTTGTAWDLAVDHCHQSGIVRGLLCNACNRGIGLLGDKSDNLTRVVAYLTKPLNWKAA